MKVYRSADLMADNKSIHIFEGGEDLFEPLHTHDFIELVYIASGSAVHTIDGFAFEVKRGDLLFMNCGCCHTFQSEEGHKYINILFSPEHLGESLLTPQNTLPLLALTAFNEMRSSSEGGKLSFSGGERRETEAMVFAMLREYTEKQTGWETVLASYLNALMVRMLRKTETVMPAYALGGIWQELGEYIEQNLDADLSLTALARKCFYNPSYFSRIFKEKFGVTLMEYITRKRLEQAVQLLETSDMPISEISRKVGFADRNSLYNAFSKYSYKAPSEYRKKK